MLPGVGAAVGAAGLFHSEFGRQCCRCAEAEPRSVGVGVGTADAHTTGRSSRPAGLAVCPGEAAGVCDRVDKAAVSGPWHAISRAAAGVGDEGGARGAGVTVVVMAQAPVVAVAAGFADAPPLVSAGGRTAGGSVEPG